MRRRAPILWDELTPLACTSISPSIGTLDGGTPVTISGRGFELGMTAKIDGVLCTSLVVTSANTLTCVTPVGTAGAKDVRLDRVTTAANATLSGGYNYLSGEDWETPSVTLLVPFTLAATPTVTVGGVTATSIVRNSATSVSCVFPSVILPDTADSVEQAVLVDDVNVGSYVTSWTPHSAQLHGLWDFRRGVTQAGTATAITAVGTGSSNYNLIPCNAAQVYTASNASLNNKPSIAMATGGYKSGTFTALMGTPAFSFVIGVAPASDGNLHVMLDGDSLFLRALFKDGSGNGADGTQYAGNRVGSNVELLGAFLFMSVWNVAASKVYQNTLTPVTGTQVSLSNITGATLGEGADRAQGYTFGGAMAMAGISDSIPSDDVLARLAAFATRVYGIAIT